MLWAFVYLLRSVYYHNKWLWKVFLVIFLKVFRSNSLKSQSNLCFNSYCILNYIS